MFIYSRAVIITIYNDNNDNNWKNRQQLQNVIVRSEKVWEKEVYNIIFR